jgi:uncharacterized phage protein gp47/JayE
MAGTTPLSTLTASLPSFPTSADIADSLRQAVGGLNSLVTNYNIGGLSQTLLEAVALALGSDASTLPNSSAEGAYEVLNGILRAAYIATASDLFLDLKVADVGVFRKPATYATASVVFVEPVAAPAGGSPHPAGALVSADSADPTQPPVIFLTITDATTAAGAIESSAATAIAVSAGSAGNCDPNTILTIQSGGGTAQSCYNPAKAQGGADTEGDDAPNGGLRARGLAAILNASQCTLSAIAEAALSYAGIVSSATADCTAIDGVTFERGNVLVYCDDGSGNLGSTSDVNHASLVAFQADLTVGKWRAAGVTVLAIGSLLLDVTAALTIDVAASYLVLGNTTAGVATAAQAAVFGLVNALPLGAPVLLATIIDVAKSVAGVSNVEVASVRVNGVAADLIPRPQEVPRCAALTSVAITVNPTPTTYN